MNGWPAILGAILGAGLMGVGASDAVPRAVTSPLTMGATGFLIVLVTSLSNRLRAVEDRLGAHISREGDDVTS
jgi:hypothetical protein